MASQKFILAGDIGGTKTSLALYSLRSGKLKVEAKETFPSKDYSGLEAVLKEFRADQTQPILAGMLWRRRSGDRRESEDTQSAMGDSRRSGG